MFYYVGSMTKRNKSHFIFWHASTFFSLEEACESAKKQHCFKLQYEKARRRKGAKLDEIETYVAASARQLTDCRQLSMKDVIYCLKGVGFEESEIMAPRR